MKCFWTENCSLPSFPVLDSDIKTYVLIIGGGMAGILTAYMLKKSGVDCVLLESNVICSGVTKNTTAKITSQHGLVYSKLVKEFGVEKAKMYFDANQNAVEQYRKLCQNINCDFEEKDAYTYSLKNYMKIEKEIKALEKIGYNAELAFHLELPFETVGAVKFKHQAQFNPLKFVSAICAGLNIYEHSAVVDLKPYKAYTKNGSVSAKKIVVATHFPFINKHGSYPLKMYQHRSYVIALKNAQQLNGMYIDESKKGFSFRNYGDYLLLGGGSHRTGELGESYDALTDFASYYYKGASVKYGFAAQDCMTLDGVPYIGMYSRSTPDFYVATGFNKWGMTSSMVSATILCDMINDKKNEYEDVFSPSRTMLRPQLAVNSFEAIKNFVSLSPHRCPHLGCALKYNPYEHSWDCPCHGSRFEKDGTLIDGPSTGNLKI